MGGEGLNYFFVDKKRVKIGLKSHKNCDKDDVYHYGVDGDVVDNNQIGKKVMYKAVYIQLTHHKIWQQT